MDKLDELKIELAANRFIILKLMEVLDTNSRNQLKDLLLEEIDKGGHDLSYVAFLRLFVQ